MSHAWIDQYSTEDLRGACVVLQKFLFSISLHVAFSSPVLLPENSSGTPKFSILSPPNKAGFEFPLHKIWLRNSSQVISCHNYKATLFASFLSWLSFLCYCPMSENCHFLYFVLFSGYLKYECKFSEWRKFSYRASYWKLCVKLL